MFEQSGRLLVPKLADEQLVEERRLVAGAARGVEDGAVGVGRARAARSAIDAGTPRPSRSARSASRPRRRYHRLGEPALLAEPVVGRAGEVGDRVRGEEVGVDAAQGGLLGDGLGAVLAELGGPAVAGRLGPGAAGAVEAVSLVEPGEGPRGAHHAHLLDGRAAARPVRPAHRPRGPCVGDHQVGFVDVGVGSLARHASIVDSPVNGRTETVTNGPSFRLALPRFGEDRRVCGTTEESRWQTLDG